MKLLAYVADKREFIGVLSEDGNFALPISAVGMEYKTMKDLIREAGPSEMEMLDFISKRDPDDVEGAVPVSDVRILSPIPEPGQDIICLGFNYIDHAEESARFNASAFKKPEAATYFSKRVNRTVDPGGAILAHRDMTRQLDYEAELAVIIGKDAKNVPAELVRDYIFGYTIMNDVSAREVQTSHNQWYFGKSLDNFTPLGPWILTTDSVAFPPSLQIRSYVNGELRQNSNTAYFINGISDVVCELSRGMTLKSGTIIATGTPAGVGMGFEPPKFLVPGDVVECCIEGIGTLKNIVVD